MSILDYFRNFDVVKVKYRFFLPIADMKTIALQQPTSTKQDILQYLLVRSQATAQELAEALDVTPQAIRRHLKDLEAEALIVHQPVPTRMGRPQHVYHLSQEGRARFPNRLAEFAVSFLNTLAATLGDEQAKDILRQHWERKATEYRTSLGNGELHDRVALLVELRQKEGYMAEWYPLTAIDTGTGTGTDTISQFILTEHNCAISPIASSFPSVCGHELEMFAAALPDCTVFRTHCIINGEHRCGYLIKAK